MTSLLVSSHAAAQALAQEAFVEVQADGSDAWRLDGVVETLRKCVLYGPRSSPSHPSLLHCSGGVGVIPTDTLYALVCDVENREAVARLYAAKSVDNPLAKPLSLLCRGLEDVSKYTAGLSSGAGPGFPNLFRVANATLPGAYTLLLPASKALPKSCVLDRRGVPLCKLRRSVGVRLPAHAVTQAILARLPRPLLCTSVSWTDDPARMHASRAGLLDFVVAVKDDEQPRRPSTVIDLRTGMPRLLRLGGGDWAPWCVEGAEDASGEPFVASEQDEDER